MYSAICFMSSLVLSTIDSTQINHITLRMYCRMNDIVHSCGRKALEKEETWKLDTIHFNKSSWGGGQVLDVVPYREQLSLSKIFSALSLEGNYRVAGILT